MDNSSKFTASGENYMQHQTSVCTILFTVTSYHILVNKYIFNFINSFVKKKLYQNIICSCNTVHHGSSPYYFPFTKNLNKNSFVFQDQLFCGFGWQNIPSCVECLKQKEKF